tara:strand:+ start:152 stop:322 length:171 start_codon:yes stop_codon:yes gene_type:complete
MSWGIIQLWIDIMQPKNINIKKAKRPVVKTKGNMKNGCIIMEKSDAIHFAPRRKKT